MSDSQPKKSFPLRISPRLFDQLRKWANDDLRSVNAQIEFLLNEAVKKRYREDDPSPPQNCET